MNDQSRTRITAALALATALALLAGCTGATAPTPPTSSGQGSQTTTAPPTMRIALVEEWLGSGHAQVIAFAAAEKGCKNCHDGATYATTGGGFVPRMNVQAIPTTGSVLATTPVVATDCRVCHTGAGVQIASNGTIDIPGQDVKAGIGALCISCHNGWHGPGKSQSGGQNAPHHSVQGDMVFMANVATVGATFQLDRRNPHQKVQDICVGCHVTGLAVPGREATSSAPPSHTLRAAVPATCMGQDCHSSNPLTQPAKQDLDGNGRSDPYQIEIDGLMQSLKSAIEKRAGGTFQSAAGEIKFAPGAHPDAEAYAAAYNYLYVDADSSRGVHSPIFTASLLQASINALGGKP